MQETNNHPVSAVDADRTASLGRKIANDSVLRLSPARKELIQQLGSVADHEVIDEKSLV
jgi:hypothetical protein